MLRAITPLADQWPDRLGFRPGGGGRGTLRAGLRRRPTAVAAGATAQRCAPRSSDFATGCTGAAVWRTGWARARASRSSCCRGSARIDRGIGRLARPGRRSAGPRDGRQGPVAGGDRAAADRRRRRPRPPAAPVSATASPWASARSTCSPPAAMGQRLGLFSGSGVGKSTLFAMLARAAVCDVAVIALVGERGREVREFLEDDLGAEGWPARSSSSRPPTRRRCCGGARPIPR